MTIVILKWKNVCKSYCLLLYAHECCIVVLVFPHHVIVSLKMTITKRKKSILSSYNLINDNSVQN